METKNKECLRRENFSKRVSSEIENLCDLSVEEMHLDEQLILKWCIDRCLLMYEEETLIIEDAQEKLGSGEWSREEFRFNCPVETNYAREAAVQWMIDAWGVDPDDVTWGCYERSPGLYVTWQQMMIDWLHLQRERSYLL